MLTKVEHGRCQVESYFQYQQKTCPMTNVDSICKTQQEKQAGNRHRNEARVRKRLHTPSAQDESQRHQAEVHSFLQDLIACLVIDHSSKNLG